MLILKAWMKYQYRSSSNLCTKHIDNALSSDNVKNCMQRLKNIQIPPRSINGDKKAAVLIPLCHVDNELCLLYTKRTSIMRRHSGQVSFPGGMLEVDENANDGALRETEEELGINRDTIEIWGHGPFIPGIEVCITPVVGYIGHIKLNTLQINRHEVQHVFALPVLQFCIEKNCKHTQFKNTVSLPVFLINGYRVWGITGYITHLFLKCFLPDVYTYEIQYVKPVIINHH